MASSTEEGDDLEPARGAWATAFRVWGGTVKRSFERAIPSRPGELLEADWWSRNRGVAGATLGGLALLIVTVAALSGSDSDDAAQEAGTVAAANVAAEPPDAPVAHAQEPEVVVVDDTRSPAPPEDRDIAAGTVFDEAERARAGDPGAAKPQGQTGASAAVDSARVVAALKARKVRAMDTLLVTTKERSGFSLLAAEEHCESLVVEGLTGWRLPHIGELHSLQGAKMLGRSTYWSSTVGDAFGDRAMMLSGRTGDSSPVPVGSKSVSTLCVRPRS